ncbi:type III pantothenate kinase [Marivirga tractuosa]|uniref:Type III pantothenate kinase n=1 Tax=Marivirga tractuosa (strain ATCC 23168 / DSM 4126 / NBRC 15989 / NCIMB 1408 / VKM B-1430 / H-43) TaxID=643867 RepID=E4TTU1_MARTH|nr:type III pantothenate kinase [Marivirga tractuosa]ADR21996.1 putative transcriptional acitvator, Baf family [Marivirga tractuosa DSM 4126]BDD13544.1 type III pantothenate kinase [Marivirga tractuosa]
MNLAIDVGNTKTKIGFFKEDRLEYFKTFDSLSELNQFIASKEIESAIISSVNTSYDEILQELKVLSNPILLSIETALPFDNQYKSKTIGLDRLAAVAGAQMLYPNKNSLVVDLGTCITYEFIEQGKVYHGGAISPGMSMRFKAMHNFTARLPLVEPESVDGWISKSTEGAMLSGVVHGIKAEIDAYIQEVERKNAPLTVIITGGDAKFFESKIKATIFAIPELVLMGLNAILRYNVPI